jgi:hypothetical protein
VQRGRTNLGSARRRDRLRAGRREKRSRPDSKLVAPSRHDDCHTEAAATPRDAIRRSGSRSEQCRLLIRLRGPVSPVPVDLNYREGHAALGKPPEVDVDLVIHGETSLRGGGAPYPG